MPQNNLFLPTVSFAGANSPTRVGQQTDGWISERHGRYYNSVYGTPAVGSTAAKAGSFFRASNSSGATLSAALATTYVGICLSNPAASTANLVVRGVGVAIIVAPGGELALGLITGWSAAGVVTHTTAITGIVNAYVGAATSSGSIVQTASQAKVDAACTIVGTPTWDRWMASNVASTNNISGWFDINDDLIIPPGGYVAVGANAAGPTAGFLGTFAWEEVSP